MKRTKHLGLVHSMCNVFALSLMLKYARMCVKKSELSLKKRTKIVGLYNQNQLKMKMLEIAAKRLWSVDSISNHRSL